MINCSKALSLKEAFGATPAKVFGQLLPSPVEDQFCDGAFVSFRGQQ
jgi:hypothetical protein